MQENGSFESNIDKESLQNDDLIIKKLFKHESIVLSSSRLKRRRASSRFVLLAQERAYTRASCRARSISLWSRFLKKNIWMQSHTRRIHDEVQFQIG